MSDLATGEKVWSTADVTPPSGVELNEIKQPASGEIRVLDVPDGKILTSWGAGAFTRHTWVTATYDMTTGKQIGAAAKYTYTGATADRINSNGSFIRSPDHQLAASSTENGTAVWQLADGKEIWAQRAGENSMTPRRFSPNGVLYGTVGADDTTALAIESRTKKVLAKNLRPGNIPLFNEPSGYGYFGTDSGLFVFPSLTTTSTKSSP
ncbi:WD40 repeat domain-containing protein [Streptomyces sp. NBC_01142]|uniref:WD40 repeat domain-containing protein n=1 Tax=Streptomyces sp. NBC_01142 TaxID=2975865 RepID=UPI0022512CCB|nr:WD40 repeat domain-containing protein [Streptomyces sp. NBC_01142]MCX4821370.1 WD40 repeat domain-containing protein [Streptomyces sp. NBC_01142]